MVAVLIVEIKDAPGSDKNWRYEGIGAYVRHIFFLSYVSWGEYVPLPPSPAPRIF